MNTDELKVLCPFCNGEQNADVEFQLDSIMDGCSTCGYGASISYTVEVRCCHCDRIIYIKEVEDADY